MKGKIIVCRCEDVTLDNVEHSIDLGYADIESVKRYTGFGTGPCQGKECTSVIARIIVERTGVEPASIQPFTSRQPIAPTPLSFYAGIPEAAVRPEGGGTAGRVHGDPLAVPNDEDDEDDQGGQDGQDESGERA